ncbi:MAG: NAD-dependent epimerase/dehydratase family protein, partial [Micromonosporaceae bacterium]|nr:NAD-dependent epimerase/dehydratase family protein [Micromonosporaceae bacterium]
MRVLVTGGAGFIGSQVVSALIEAGHDAWALDNLHPAAHAEAANRSGNRDAGDRLIVGDIRDRATVDAALAGADAVVHHA